MKNIYLVVDNVRSALNVGSMLRSSDGLGIYEVMLCGYTPYPAMDNNDQRLPYIAQKITKRINKTALGAEQSQNWSHYVDTETAIKRLRAMSVEVLALEQTAHAIELTSLNPKSANIALIVGNERTGLEDKILSLVDSVVAIPMLGKKESFNVSAAAAMAMFYLKYML